MQGGSVMELDGRLFVFGLKYAFDLTEKSVMGWLC